LLIRGFEETKLIKHQHLVSGDNHGWNNNSVAKKMKWFVRGKLPWKVDGGFNK
jgi:hypothetical protein